MRNSYRFFDQLIQSDIDLPELDVTKNQLPNDTSEVPALKIYTGSPARAGSFSLVHEWGSDDEVEMACSKSADSYRLEFQSLLTATLDTRRREVYVDLGSSDIATVRHLLLDQALPRFFSGLDRVVLHAACLSKGETTIGLLGQSGSGKSTLAASLTLNGWSLLSDDCVIVDHQSGHVCGSYAGLRLEPDMASKVLNRVIESAPMADYSDKQRIVVPQIFSASPSRLDAIIFLADSSQVPSAHPVCGSEALLKLVAESFSLDPTDGVIASRKISQLAAVIEAGVPMIALNYPRKLESLERVKKFLLQSLELED